MVPPGHKVAVQRAGRWPGDALWADHRVATKEIKKGQHVHTQNLYSREFEKDYAFCEDYEPVELVPESERRTFMGFKRADGRVGTRNYVAVIASVNCSSSATAAVAEYFRQPGMLDEYPNVDGVIALPHKGGCGAHVGSRDLYIFQRTLAGIVHHPNVGGYVMLSLGCEVNQPTDMIEATELEGDAADGAHHPAGRRFPENGRSRHRGGQRDSAAGEQGARGNRFLRRSWWSRFAMRRLGRLVGCDRQSGSRQGGRFDRAARAGRSCSARQPRSTAAEHLLTRRAKSPEVAQKLIDMIHWWEQYTAYFGGTIDNNPAPGNKAGRVDDDLREVARRGGEGRFDADESGRRATASG